MLRGEGAKSTERICDVPYSIFPVICLCPITLKFDILDLIIPFCFFQMLLLDLTITTTITSVGGITELDEDVTLSRLVTLPIKFSSTIAASREGTITFIRGDKEDVDL
jgi:hypothetical protein